MATAICARCGEELGFFSQKFPVTDGVFCKACLKSAGITSLRQSWFVKDAMQLIDERRRLTLSFTPTKKIGSYLLVDERAGTFKIENGIYKYEDLLSYELMEDGESVAKGGIGRAVAGGLLFGSTGAIVGGITGKKRTKRICTSLRIKVTFRDTAPCDLAYINFISSETKVGGLFYQSSMQLAQSCLSAFQIIAEKMNQADKTASGQISAADEILKFKNLMDAGVITEEEFLAKKKQLLGL